MTWTIWINFLPLSHGSSTWNLASIGPGVLEKIFEHTYTHTHTNTQNWIGRLVKNSPPPAFKAPHPVFFHLEQLSAVLFWCARIRVQFIYCLVSVCIYVCMYVHVCLGRFAFVKMCHNFLQVVVLLKNAVLWISFVQMRSFGIIIIIKMMNKQNLCSPEKLSLGEYTVLYIRANPG